MDALKIVRYMVWGLVALSAVVLGAVAYDRLQGGTLVQGVATVGGPFALTDHTGKRVTEKDFTGKPTLVFFGYTHCPDVCPTTLYETTQWLAALGDKADRLNVLFISVDPERDTVPVLADYMKAFDPRIRGLTGTPEEVAEAAKAWRAYYAKVPGEGTDYTMNHQAVVYMMDERGLFAGTISYEESKDQALLKLGRLVS